MDPIQIREGRLVSRTTPSPPRQRGREQALRVGEVMTRDLTVVTPRTSVSEARRLMRRGGFRHLPVVDGGRLVGILSDRDVTITDRQLAESLASLESDVLYGQYRQVGAVMTRGLYLTTPHTELATAARLLAVRRVGALPVVDGERLVGILTTTDCLRVLQDVLPAPGSTPASAGHGPPAGG